MDSTKSGHLWQLRATGFFPVWIPGIWLPYIRMIMDQWVSVKWSLVSCSLRKRGNVKADIIVVGFKGAGQGRSFRNDFTGRL